MSGLSTTMSSTAIRRDVIVVSLRTVSVTLEHAMVSLPEKSVPPLKTSNGVVGVPAIASGCLMASVQTRVFFPTSFGPRKTICMVPFGILVSGCFRSPMNSWIALVTAECKTCIETLLARALYLGQRRLTNRLTHTSHRLAQPRGSREMLARGWNTQSSRW